MIFLANCKSSYSAFNENIWGLELGSDSCSQTFRRLDPPSWNKNRAQYSSVHEKHRSKIMYFYISVLFSTLRYSFAGTPWV